MRLTVRNGTVVTAAGCSRADIVCEGEHIEEVVVGRSVPPGDCDIDATGRLVFAGFIDPHVHSRDPGLTHKEDFWHSTAAAAAGGVTTILEMPNAVPPVADVATLSERGNVHSRVAWVDFGLWGMSLGGENLGDVAALIRHGAVAIKLFWAYALDRRTKELIYNPDMRNGRDVIPPPGPAEVLALFKTVSSKNGLLAAHCEDRETLESSERELGHQARTYDDLLELRPDAAEASSVAQAIELCRLTGCRFHVVHMASARALNLVRDAQRNEILISAETCPHYLTLSDRSFAEIGPLMKVYPPIRRLEDQAALRAGVVDGTITSVGSDHAPHTIDEKSGRLEDQPAGIIGVETMARVMLNEAAEGRIPVEKIAWVLAEGTARLYRLYPRKGAILPGADADFTIVDPNRRWTIRNDDLHSKNPLSPWDGWAGSWSPVMSVLRGRVVMDDGVLIGRPGGRWLRPL